MTKGKETKDMSVAHKANEWLLKNGHIQKITRGRRSAENTARLAEAYKSGIRFSDWEPSETTDEAGKTVVKNVAPATSNPTAIHDIKFTYPEKDFEAYAEVRGKKIPVGMREVCSNCISSYGIHVSLTAHVCASPSVSTVMAAGLGSPTPVSIVPRKTPLPVKPW